MTSSTDSFKPVPFCTYASTYRDETLARIVELTPDAKHLKGFGAVSKNTKGIAFFDKFDCNEKTLIPFSTHGGSGWSGTIEDIKGLVPNATNNTATSRNGILNWLQEINITSK